MNMRSVRKKLLLLANLTLSCALITLIIFLLELSEIISISEHNSFQENYTVVIMVACLIDGVSMSLLNMIFRSYKVLSAKVLGIFSMISILFTLFILLLILSK